MTCSHIRATIVCVARLLPFVFLCEPALGVDRDYPVRPVPFADVEVADVFWAPRMEINYSVSIPHCFEMCEKSGRIANFAKAAGQSPGAAVGFPWGDSDVYKILEGAAYALQIKPDPHLEQYVDDLISQIAAAQMQDG